MSLDQATSQHKLLIARPLGFCAGVDRALKIVDEVLAIFGAPIFVKHEIVHNFEVVNKLKQQGVEFIEDLEAVPPESVLIYSAHGVNPEIKSLAQKRNLRVFDATCPLVTKIHIEVSRISQKGGDCVVIGHAKHPEIIGTMGYFDPTSGGKLYLVQNLKDAEILEIEQPENVYYVSQTTLSLDETADIIMTLQQRYPKIRGPHKEDICYATQNRQNALKAILKEIDFLYVIGHHTSSNTNRLVDLASSHGVAVKLIENQDGVSLEDFAHTKNLGLTAGASAPEWLVESVLQALKQHLPDIDIQERELVEEKMAFSIPHELRLLKQGA